jgi:O-acetyl-ADP-ribose deacetylase (regulator of RNase III)
MIELTRGDIVKADAEALVNSVNCVGVMGRGIALQFKKAFPENYKAYRAACELHQVQPGRMLIHDRSSLTNPRYIINFPTKTHWKARSRLVDIEAGLSALVEEVRRLGIRSIALPPLGCGLGGLNWEDVRPRIERAFRDLSEARVLVFEPAGAPAPDQMAKESRKPRMTVGKAALLGLVQRYLAPAMDPSVTLMEIHKLMYFMQAAGEPLRLHFQNAPYGPYARNLRHVLSQIEGHFISGYGDAEDRPDKQIELIAEAAEAAERFLAAHPDTRERFQRVASLIEGFETPFGMELIATVHWVASQEGACDVEAARRAVYDWNERKRMFKPEHIRIAWETLANKGWLRERGASDR